MIFNKSFFVLLIFLFFAKDGVTQNFEWLRTNYSYTSMSTTALPDGGAVTLISFRGGANLPDTIKLDTFKFLTPKKTNQAFTLLALINSKGKITNARIVYYCTLSSYTIPGIRDICSDDSGNIFIIGYLSDNPFNIIGKDTLDVKNGAILFAKLNKDLQIIWVSQTAHNKVFATADEVNNFWPKTSLAILEGHLYFTCASSGSSKIGSKSYSFNGIATSIFGELNPSKGNVIWSNYLNSSQPSNMFRISGLVKVKNKLYLSGDFSYSTINVIAIISSDTFYSPGGFIVQTDSIGNYVKGISIHNKDQIQINCLTTDGKYLYFGGNFRDSLQWGGSKIAPGYKTGSKKVEMFAASINSFLKPRWFFSPQILDTTLGKDGSIGFNRVTYSDGYIYYGGRTGTKLLVDSTVLGTISGIILLKADSLGNILWANSGGGGFIADMDVAKGSVFSTGIFYGKIQFGIHTDSTSYKNFITKITNYSIDRGRVYRGPYCAGDTIKVPYDLEGDFDKSNVVIAELSDEYGNFNGNQHELGRIKSYKDSTINGVLPMFKVVSSPYYRIRVRSTQPAVQSFYLWDTLQVLIYSRDKADPGKDEFVCMGDTLKLNTYGGTKWTWSPKYRMSDSTKRQPLVWPLKDTIYKIIIADSSGCGKPDTAFKKIFVRPYPTSKLQFKDTAVCDNSMLKIPVKFVGGDSVYQWQWYFVNPDKSFFKFKSGKLKPTDTLNYYPSVTNTTSEKLAIILKDGCTAKADTAFLTISLRKKIEIKPFRDTTLCIGNIVNYKAQATGGVAKQYHYQWKDITNNTIISTNDSLKIKAQKTFKIELSINDGCKALGDSKEFTIIVKPPLKALTNLRDTTICAAKPLNYTAQAIGGNDKNYKFSWLLNGNQIDTINHLQLTINNSSTLSLITKDNCSPNDTVKKTITVNPSPKADFNWDLECNRTVTKFQFTGTKPNSPITTIFHWNFNNEASSSVENPSKLFSTIGAKTLTLALTSSNSCTDTIKKTIEIKPQSKADFTATDVCETDSAVFINKSQDATGYNWKFGDGQTTNLPTPKHNYKISNTTTYNVTLVAQVTNGCADSVTKAVTINKNPSSDFSYTYNGTKVDLKITKAGNSYQWKFGTTDSAKTSATTYSHTIKSSDQTKVCLTATDISGCSSQTCKNVSVGILKVSEKSFKIYPNPNNGSFNIEIENPSKEVSIEIFNLLGERVKKVETNSSKSIYEIDLNSTDGIYLVKVKNGISVWNQKVLISY